ncbi:MAG: ABC transporter permease subunit, partial [Actinobacteria bacterium]|nr:ABC transporter permease subunit [Actinomycetota bacterium]NIS30271.1 ABC transporter permease subunit [Actinomycetota bacterium]NIU65863.1 ABC transporter permease subunit [Actinomycetota bacterium]NIV86485.1 ABC transporter permease subunit [Actinomycetota bacterium]NIW27658.1 ABC transporter permease subunit [Actinomycetota bacterium]
SGGVVVGIMLIPTVASVSEDAMSAVPNALREAGYGLGATRSTVALRIVFPAAISGIVAAIILAMSRAVG